MECGDVTARQQKRLRFRCVQPDWDSGLFAGSFPGLLVGRWIVGTTLDSRITRCCPMVGESSPSNLQSLKAQQVTIECINIADI